MNDNHWIDAQLLLQCDWVHSDHCVGVEVRLYNLHLLQRIAVKEPYKTQWADIYRVAEKAGHELLGVGGHLGIRPKVGMLGILGMRRGLLGGNIYLVCHSLQFFLRPVYAPFRGPLNTNKKWFLVFSISFFVFWGLLLSSS